jgi:hypothetical protein
VWILTHGVAKTEPSEVVIGRGAAISDQTTNKSDAHIPYDGVADSTSFDRNETLVQLSPYSYQLEPETYFRVRVPAIYIAVRIQYAGGAIYGLDLYLISVISYIASSVLYFVYI